MAYDSLKSLVRQYINTNAENEITGQILQNVLITMIDELGSEYSIEGIATPTTNPGSPSGKAMYFASQSGTYTYFDGATLPLGIHLLVYNGTSWSHQTFFAVDATPTSGSSNFISSGAVFDAFKNDGGAYDVSVHFPTGGVNGGNTYTLDSAIAKVPSNMRKGGMSIKFVQSSDNNYIQARLMADSFTTDITKWQVVEEKPKASSPNLVDSAGVFDFASKAYNSYANTLKDYPSFKGAIQNNGTWDVSTEQFKSIFIPVEAGDNITIIGGDLGYYFGFFKSLQYPAQGTSADLAGSLKYKAANTKEAWITPSDAKYISVQVLRNGNDSTPVYFAINGCDICQRLYDYINGNDANVKAAFGTPLISKTTAQLADINRLFQLKGIINSSGEWAAVDNNNYMHSAIGVKEGDVITIQGGGSNSNYCAFFSSIEDCLAYKPITGTLQYMTYTGERSITIPAGVGCFEFSTLYNGNDVTPIVFKINGIDIRTSIYDKLLYTNIVNGYKNIYSDFDTYPRLTGIINGSGEWTAVDNSDYYHTFIPVNGGGTLVIDYPSITSYGLFVEDITFAKNGITPSAVGSLKGVAREVKNTFAVPNGANYFILSTKQVNVITYKDITVNGNSLKSSIYHDVMVLKKDTNEIYDFIVDVNGSGDFTSLRDCMIHIGQIIGEYTEGQHSPEFVYTENKTGKEFNVYIKAGTYDVRSYFTNEEWTSDDALNKIGLIIPRGVNLIGLGKKRSDVIITCTSETTDDRKSTINIQDDVRLENLTIIGNHTRYTVHDDYSYYPYSNKYGSYRRIKDVDFIGENLLYNTVYGSGTKGGADWVMKNCRFINKTAQYCLGLHDRDGYEQTAPENFLFKNCEFIGLGGPSSLTFKGYTGACDENVDIIGCMFKGIRIASGNSDATSHYTIRGNGNTKNWSLVIADSIAITKKSAPKFSDDETVVGFNIGQSAISYGDYVTIDVNGDFEKSSISTDYIALEDISVGECGAVKVNI